MKIIYDQQTIETHLGVLSFLVPSTNFLATLEGTEEEKMIHIANKDLPTGTKYEIVEDDYLPTDRTFRGAWEYVAGASEKTSADLSAEDLAKYGMTENK